MLQAYPGVNVNEAQIVSTDFDGKFQLSNVKDGFYFLSLDIKFLSLAMLAKSLTVNLQKIKIN
jgi:hypothetical protein